MFSLFQKKHCRIGFFPSKKVNSWNNIQYEKPEEWIFCQLRHLLSDIAFLDRLKGCFLRSRQVVALSSSPGVYRFGFYRFGFAISHIKRMHQKSGLQNLTSDCQWTVEDKWPNCVSFIFFPHLPPTSCKPSRPKTIFNHPVFPMLPPPLSPRDPCLQQKIHMFPAVVCGQKPYHLGQYPTIKKVTKLEGANLCHLGLLKIKRWFNGTFPLYKVKTYP